MRLIDVDEVFICGFLALIVISSLALSLHLLLRLFTLIPTTSSLSPCTSIDLTLQQWQHEPCMGSINPLTSELHVDWNCKLGIHKLTLLLTLLIVHTLHQLMSHDYHIYNIAKGHEAHTCDKPWPNSLNIYFLGSPTPYVISALNLYYCFSHWTIFTIVISHLRSILMYFIHPLDVIKSHYYRLFGWINERRDV